MTHKAVVVPKSITNLGANGIAFSVWCCSDEKTIERHTIVHAHTLTTEELQTIVENQYCVPCAAAHQAAEMNANHLRALTGDEEITECEGCQ